jgi:hypothetical protein
MIYEVFISVEEQEKIEQMYHLDGCEYTEATGENYDGRHLIHHEEFVDDNGDNIEINLYMLYYCGAEAAEAEVQLIVNGEQFWSGQWEYECYSEWVFNDQYYVRIIGDETGIYYDPDVWSAPLVPVNYFEYIKDRY